MPGTPFPFPKSSTPGARPGEGEGRLFNCYATFEGGRTYIRLPRGLVRFIATGKSGIRGLIDVNGVIYAVFNGSVVKITGSTVETLSGTVAGSDPVTLARNNRVTDGVSTPDLVAVRQSGGAYVISGTTVTAYPDADLPGTVNSGTFLEGFLLYSIPDGRIFASELNSTDINALSFATAEARSDGLRRIIVRGNLAYAMGGTTIEIWKNVGTSPFPLQRSPTVMQVGLLTTMAVAGFEDSWNAPAYFVSSDKRVMALDGYSSAPVSTPDVQRFIAASTASTIEVLAYVWDGVPFIAVSSDVGTWVYDVEARAWHERGTVTYSSETGVQTGRWKAKYSIYAATEQWIFGDATSGDLLVMSADNTDGEGFFQSGNLKDFPADIETKLNADFSAVDMTVKVSWTGDGVTWATELDRSLANAGKYPVDVASLGKSSHRGFVIRVRWSDPGDFSFMGATATRTEARNR